MKYLLLTLFAVLLLVGTSCHEKIDIEKEKAAIIAVIEEETDAYIAGDFERQSETYVQDETIVRLAPDKNGYVYYVGWEDLSTYLKSGTEEGLERFGYTNPKYEKTDYRIKVYHKSAWAIFNEDWDLDYQGESVNLIFLGVRFLEKVDGEWKIVYMSEINKSSLQDEDEEVGTEEVASETEDTE
jgi:hypothetical protein